MPVAAGTFYPSTRAELEAWLGRFSKKINPSFSHGICPHAGYVYSGECAAETFINLKEPDTFLIMGPNHYNIGEDIAMDKRVWETPLGIIEIDTTLATELENYIEFDPRAHEKEHSIEVLLPFIKYFFPNSKFLPIIIKTCDPKELGNVISKAIKKSRKKVSIIASTDLTHYGNLYGFKPFPPEKAIELDKQILEAIANLEIKKFEGLGKKTTMCGYYGVRVLMEIMEKKGKILKYTNSTEISGDKQNFVGYGSVVFK